MDACNIFISKYREKLLFTAFLAIGQDSVGVVRSFKSAYVSRYLPSGDEVVGSYSASVLTIYVTVVARTMWNEELEINLRGAKGRNVMN